MTGKRVHSILNCLFAIRNQTISCNPLFALKKLPAKHCIFSEMTQAMMQEARILVLNTSALERSDLAQVWQATGMSITAKEVRTRDAFLDALASEPPDLVLNLCLFPELDGIAALRLAQEAQAKVPFVILGEKRSNAAEECLAAGATAFFAKGEEEHLAEFIKRLNGNAAAHSDAPPRSLCNVALWIEPLSLRLKVEKMLLKSGEARLVPLQRNLLNATHAPDLLLVALNDLTPTLPSDWDDHPLLLLASEDRETEAIELVRRRALGYLLLEHLSEPRLHIALRQVLRQIALQRLHDEHQEKITALQRALTDLQDRLDNIESALAGEKRHSDLLKTELAEQGQLLMELMKENEERQFWYEALLQRELRFRKMVEQSSDLIALLDENATIIYESSAAEHILGYCSAELVGRSAFDFVFPDDRAMTEELFAKYVSTPGIMPLTRFRVMRKDGRLIYVEAIGNNLLHDDTVGAIILNVRDVTEYMLIQQELQKAKDDFEHRVIERTRDLIELSRKLQEEIQARKRIEETLHQSEDYFWKIFRLSPVAIVLCRADNGRTLNVNQAFETLSGIGYEDALGKSIEDLGFGFSADKLCAYLSLQPDAGARKPLNLEIELRAKNGDVRHLVATVQYVELGSERCGLILAQDVTERKQAEQSLEKSLAEKEILLKEIHHRVKNNLQVISSLLYLQSLKLRDEEAKEVFRESQNRVKSMALIHEQLYQTEDFSKVDFAEYLRNLAGVLAESYGTSAVIEVQAGDGSLDLSIDSAVPAGLIVSELVTNSLKYAFPESRRDAEETEKISILAEKTSDGEIMLTVRDNGIGLDEAQVIDSPKTLGLRLVKMLTEQLRGSIEAFSQGGAVFRIRFKEESPA